MATYKVSVGSFSQLINVTGQTNNSALVVVPAIGVQTKTQLTVIAKSIYNEVLNLTLSVTGMVTLRSTMESLFVYPMITLVEGAVISMSLSNLTQNCGDSYTIILYDPTNTTLLHSVTDSAFSYASNVNGSNLVLISYTTALATIKSNKFHVSACFFSSAILM